MGGLIMHVIMKLIVEYFLNRYINIEITQLNCIWTEVLQIIIIFAVLKKYIYIYYFIHNENNIEITQLNCI